MGSDMWAIWNRCGNMVVVELVYGQHQHLPDGACQRQEPDALVQ